MIMCVLAILFFIAKNYIFYWLDVSVGSMDPAQSGQCVSVLVPSFMVLALTY